MSLESALLRHRQLTQAGVPPQAVSLSLASKQARETENCMAELLCHNGQKPMKKHTAIPTSTLATQNLPQSGMP